MAVVTDDVVNAVAYLRGRFLKDKAKTVRGKEALIRLLSGASPLNDEVRQALLRCLEPSGWSKATLIVKKRQSNRTAKGELERVWEVFRIGEAVAERLVIETRMAAPRTNGLKKAAIEFVANERGRSFETVKRASQEYEREKKKNQLMPDIPHEQIDTLYSGVAILADDEKG